MGKVPVFKEGLGKAEAPQELYKWLHSAVVFSFGYVMEKVSALQEGLGKTCLF